MAENDKQINKKPIFWEKIVFFLQDTNSSFVKVIIIETKKKSIDSDEYLLFVLSSRFKSF